VETVPVVVLKEGTGVPLCCIHDGFGFSWSYRALGNYLDCPIIGINQIPQNGELGSIRRMASSYADSLQAFYPTGPYRLLGWSFGGVVAHELAIELHRRGCEVERLVLLDAAFNGKRAGRRRRGGRQVQGEALGWSRKLRTRVRLRRVGHPLLSRIITRNQALAESQILEYILRTNRLNIPAQAGLLTYWQAKKLSHQREAVEFAPPPKQMFKSMVQNVNANQLYLLEHVPDVFDGDMVIFSAARSGNEDGSSNLQSWRPYVTGDITEYSVDCTHYEMLSIKSLRAYGKRLKLLLGT
jgi:thioesterase domain-containing protein